MANTDEAKDFLFRCLVGGVISGVAHMAGYIPTTKPLVDRPSIWYGSLHATLVSMCALLVTMDIVDLSWWPRFGLPMSMGYMAYDLIAWCLPKLDWALILHHFVVIFVHAPMGLVVGQEVCGAGDKEWALRTAAFVYLMELSVPPLNYRWYLRKTLKRSALRYVTNSKLEYIKFVFSEFCVSKDKIISFIIVGVYLIF